MLMIICLYCEEKFDADHPWGFKDNNNSRTVMLAKLNECYISKKEAKSFGLASKSAFLVKVCPFVAAK